jgi:uncharacterized protein (TIGR02646 family)
MIHVGVKVIPVSLVGATSVGVIETKKAKAFYKGGAHADDSFDFKAYKSEDVNAALTAEFHGKCAYCESPYEATHPVDIEHYRPKGGYVRDNKLTKPGYYWLAADWMNLLPSCIDCNRRRRQRFKDEPKHLAGKANLFPIADETKRATRPGQEDREGRLLLHPRRDFPHRHLEFFGQGEVRERIDRAGTPSPMAEASIKVYGLRRAGLSKARKERFMLIDGSITRIKLMQEGLQQSPNNVPFRKALESEIESLRAMVKPGAPYSAMARQLAGPTLRAAAP